jgi:hypothetical protein
MHPYRSSCKLLFFLDSTICFSVWSSSLCRCIGDAHRAGKALLTLILADHERHDAELGERVLQPELSRQSQGFTERP